MCDELSIGCSPPKNQILSTWVILAQKYVSFISCIVNVLLWCVCILHKDLVYVTYLYANKDLIKN
jgi:hypothetical protein